MWCVQKNYGASVCSGKDILEICVVCNYLEAVVGERIVFRNQSKPFMEVVDSIIWTMSEWLKHEKGV